MRELMPRQGRFRRSIVGGSLAGAIAIGLLGALPGNGVAALPADPTAPTCAEGGACALGDTGPGGGTVFFVKAVGEFAASRFFADPDPNCAQYDECFDNTQAVSLTAMAQAALPFDYLEVAPASGEVIRSWSGTQDVVSGAMHSAIGAGASNTAAMIATIVSDTVSSSAARYAGSYAGGGLTDWFLPSIDELSLILIRQATYGTQMGTFDPNQWSSTDCCGNSARALSFTVGQNLYVTKNAGVIGVRPVRAFSVTVQPTTTTTSTAATSTTTTSTAATTTTTPTTTTPTTPTTTTPTTTTPTDPPATQPDTTVLVTTQPMVRDPATAQPEPTVPATMPPDPTGHVPLTEDAVVRMPLESVGVPNLVGSAGQVTVTAAGLVAGEAVGVYVASEPVLLGSGIAAGDGTFSMTVALPADLLGQHSVVVYQPTTGRSVRQAIQIVSPELPRTGTGSTVLQTIAIVLLLAGIGCVLAARRRVGTIAMRHVDAAVNTGR